MLELKGIKKDYLAGENTVHALKGIDLSFRKSEFVAILGPSGCGKTTMLNIIGGLDQYTEGDLVINGQESGGGSIRIFSRDIQRRMFKVLGFSEEDIQAKFGFFVDAFNYGTPPHGGLAYGMDRLVMLMLGESSIREVIAFPKNANAQCLMSGAPGLIEQSQLDELAIRTVPDAE